jgi:hypothetical protein
MGQLSSMILGMAGPSITEKFSKGDFLSPYRKTLKSYLPRITLPYFKDSLVKS